MDMKILRNEADAARAEAESIKRLVAHKADKAAGLDGYGAPDRADVERREAEGLQNDAEELEKKAAALDAMIETAHKRVEALNAEEEAVRKDYEGKLKAIDDERHQLLGE